MPFDIESSFLKSFKFTNYACGGKANADQSFLFINNLNSCLTSMAFQSFFPPNMATPIQLNWLFYWVFSLNCFFSHSQEGLEQNSPDYIKSVVFKALNSEIQFPVLESGARFVLEFDDLQAIDADYYYKISYFNYDWSPSNLFKNEYLAGFDNLRIDDFRSSTNTLQRYTHYRLQLPNDNTRFLLSGNYMLEIYNSDDALVFSRRFLISKNEAFSFLSHPKGLPFGIQNVWSR
jgi:hypothetical protein